MLLWISAGSLNKLLFNVDDILIKYSTVFMIFTGRSIKGFLVFYLRISTIDELNSPFVSTRVESDAITKQGVRDVWVPARCSLRADFSHS